MSGIPVILPESGNLSSPSKGPSLASAVTAILRDPVGVILARWNWKSALLSVVLRGPTYFLVSIRHGWREALAAVGAEVLYCAATSGFYGALTQALCDAEPEWLTALLITFLMPVLMQWIEFLVHFYRGTHNLAAVISWSILISAISSLFNWYAMRRGTLLMGEKSKSFGRDLASLPLLAWRFVLAGVQLVAHALRGRSAAQRT